MDTLQALRNLVRYELVGDKPIGGGGCGVVWQARDVLFDQDVAIKTIGERLLAGDREVAERTLRKEAIAAARLSQRCRYIVRVLDLGRINDTFYLVMEWIGRELDQPGIDITHRLGAMSLGDAKAILFDVCEAVRHAHTNGIVHSDIAPGNIVRDPVAGVWKLADFGLLRIIESWLLSQGSGSLLTGGRAAFFPPRVRRDFTQIDYASDVYALAVTFRLMLEGPAYLRTPANWEQPIPGVVRITRDQRDAPDQVRQLLSRFIDGHAPNDTVKDFVAALQRVPN